MALFQKLRNDTAIVGLIRASLNHAIDNDGGALSFDEFARTLQTREREGLTVHPLETGTSAPLSQQSFFDAVRQGRLDAEKAKRQLEKFYENTKKEQGFLRSCFRIVTGENPLDEAMKDIVKFDRFCAENNISFDNLTQELVCNDKRKELWDHVKEWRFAIAALTGIGLGASGMNLADGTGIDLPGYQEHIAPLMNQSIGLFFSKGLPWLGAGFISLNIFKAFSEYSIKKEIGTLGRFAAITAAGFAVSFLVTEGMTSVLPPPDPGQIPGVDYEIGSSGFSPMAYIPYIAMGAACFAGIYKAARNTASRTTNAFTHAAAGAAVGLGKAGLFGARVVNKAFPSFINWVGIPAVATLLSATMCEGGLEQLGTYGNYYATAFTGMAIGTALMLGGLYAMGCRGKKDFGQILSAYKEGVLISSSSAVLPKEQKCLRKIGLSEETIGSVTPLAGVFNMYGTSLYLGLTAFYALKMFNSDPTLAQYAGVAAAAFTVALGAPGIPSSNIAFLSPVMEKTGLDQLQIQKIYAMVLPMDRFLDMKQTGMNVMGDMFAPIWKDRKILKERNQKATQAAAELPPPQNKLS